MIRVDHKRQLLFIYSKIINSIDQPWSSRQ